MTTAPPGIRSRTFVGLLAAQFLAAFNDQAIHAAAMFYAINSQSMTERDAISLMPILFYAPWAIFCTVAGWLADRYSKRTSLVAWKVAEVGITAVALLGFSLGSPLGPWIVLGCVFLMGTHSAFFVPAKYGIMPQILPSEELSRGNGLLESLSFLAVILGTVSGGVLSYLFLRNEAVIGIILFALALIGAAASLFIRPVPAADPGKPFPRYVYGPLWTNLRRLVRDNSLRVALMGLVFFTFVVSFMRATVYMLGESRNPRWDELKTSVVVGTVALGIGLGSPLAGWLSGKKIELRLVPFGALGMIFGCLGAAVFLERVPVLVGCIIGIGFFTGFYLVPLFTLLQHAAPKASKGDLIATSNFANVTGAILASVLFFGVVYLAQRTGLVPEVTHRTPVGTGLLTRVDMYRGRPVHIEVALEETGRLLEIGKPAEDHHPLSLRELVRHVIEPADAGEPNFDLDKAVPTKSEVSPAVTVTEYSLGGVRYVDVVRKGANPAPDYDLRRLPKLLFLGAAGMTLLILFALWKPIRVVRRQTG
ncbi:MAG TPA: MFS transporter [Fimbriiglobus sp.]|jgi:MFS family permease